MKVNIKMDKEQLKTIGNGALKIGKAIIIEGTKAVAFNGVKAVVSTSYTKGLGGVKELELDDYINGGKKKKAKKLFSFKKKKNETEGTLETEVVIETVEADEIVEPETITTK